MTSRNFVPGLTPTPSFTLIWVFYLHFHTYRHEKKYIPSEHGWTLKQSHSLSLLVGHHLRMRAVQKLCKAKRGGRGFTSGFSHDIEVLRWGGNQRSSNLALRNLWSAPYLKSITLNCDFIISNLIYSKAITAFANFNFEIVCLGPGLKQLWLRTTREVPLALRSRGPQHRLPRPVGDRGLQIAKAFSQRRSLQENFGNFDWVQRDRVKNRQWTKIITWGQWESVSTYPSDRRPMKKIRITS